MHQSPHARSVALVLARPWGGVSLTPLTRERGSRDFLLGVISYPHRPPPWVTEVTRQGGRLGLPAYGGYRHSQPSYYSRINDAVWISSSIAASLMDHYYGIYSVSLSSNQCFLRFSRHGVFSAFQYLHCFHAFNAYLFQVSQITTCECRYQGIQGVLCCDHGLA